MKKTIICVLIIFLCLTASVFADDIKDMYNAIMTGDLAKAKTLLDGGFDPNTFLPDGQPAVMEAAQTGNIALVDLFIKSGADVTLMADNNFGGNALTGAIWSTRDTHDPANTNKIIQMLIDAGIDINSGEVRNESDDYEVGGKLYMSYINPVWFVTGGADCNADVLEFMISKGNNLSWSYVVTEANDERRDASLEETIDAVKKSKSNKKDKKEYNRIMKILKDAEQKPAPKAVAAPAPAPSPAPAPEPQPAVKEAAKAPAQQPEAKKAPAQKPVEKQAPVKEAKPPKAAKTKPQKPVSKPAPAAKEAPKTYSSVIMSPSEATELLRKSVSDGNKENFYRSLVMGADVNNVDNENKSVLLLAVMSNKTEMVEVLIHKGADVNIKSKGGNTPLSMARDLGSDDIVKLLTDAGAK